MTASANAAVTDTTFDLGAALPAGVTVLEASAGTGKTFTIAALAARYVAAGLPLRSLLLVTFTRMATGELRERVRDRLAGAERELARVLAGGARPGAGSGDEVLEILTAGDEAQLRERHAHLARALADFDAATISTIHGFCQTALTGLGVAADVDGDVTFVEDTRDLLGEIVEDFYIRKFKFYNPPAFTLDEARSIARRALANPLAPLEPAAAEPGSVPDIRYRFAIAVRDEMERRKREQKLLTFDDLLSQLAQTLRDPARGPVARRRLRAQYRVVLVDEFQDTDPIQWEIMWRAFGPEPGSVEVTEAGALPRALVLIGDPKQAIYAFRGADVQAYLDAAHEAGARSTLGTNWRSDQGLLTAYDALLRGTNLGHPDIAYRTVEAAAANREPRLTGAPCPSPLRLRVVHRDDGIVRTTPKEGWASSYSARAHVAEDLAADVAALLSSGAEILRRDGDGTVVGRHPVNPGDLAVLVRANWQTAMVCDALAEVGVPAVINGAGSVFGTPIAREWLMLLEALERPASEARVHAVAGTCFFGWSAARIADADDDEWETVHARLHRWAVVLREFGVASLLERVTRREALPRRLLERHDGDRRLTDLRHIGQLLHAETMSSRLGLTSLAAWLRQRIHDIDDVWPDDQSRRLESDADAVQVLTIHRSKGLEFPIVYYPFLWEKGRFDDKAPQLFHDPDQANRLTIDVGLRGASFDAHVKLALQEQRGEDLRLLYVALTRARHQAIVWWATSWDAGQSPLGRLLFAGGPDGNVALACPPPAEKAVVDLVRATDAAGAGLISVERTREVAAVRWPGPGGEARPLDVRRFDRTLDLQWRRTSYTALTSGAHEPGVTTEPEDAGLTDEALLDEAAVGGAEPAAPVATTPDGGGDPAALPVVPLDAMPGGAAIGSLVHAMFEHTDFTAADLDAELAARLADQSWRQLDLGDPAMVVAGLRAAIETPLGPLVDDRRLRDLGRADRLDELDFELPLVGGDEPSGRLTLAAIAALLRTHLPADDALAGYADRLDRLDADGTDGALGELRGYLVGSIDLSMRVVGADGTPRVTVVDYKTNWLGAPGDPLTAWAYRPDALVAAMEHAHYPLQALIYSVALHRYLRWRLAGYDAEQHLGGVLYLFIRGMTGADVPRVGGHPCGVFSWHPPAALVVALSDLFDQGVRA